MAVRTSAANVKLILVEGKQYDNVNNPSLTAFIDTASSIVDKLETDDADALLSTSDLELIERWLAAWAYERADQMYTSRSTGGASASFQGQTGMHFDSNYYGQTAMMLDTTGYLSMLNQQAKTGRKTAGMVWLGTRYKNDESERTSDQ